MGHAIRTVSAAERRRRLAVRHHLAPGERAGTAAAAVVDIIGLHGTDPASVYLAAWARTREVDKAAIEHAMYEELPSRSARASSHGRTRLMNRLALSAIAQHPASTGPGRDAARIAR